MHINILIYCSWVILIFGPVVSACPCDCERGKMVCKNRWIDLPMLKIPENITEVHLSNNNLGHVSSDILEKLKDLTHLEIKYNNLENIPVDTFRKFKNLKTLVLNNNKITILDKNSFRGLKNLLNLEITFNKLQTLPIGVFDDLRSIESIRLQYNEIHTIPNYVFTPLKSLQSLFLTNNKIATMEDKAFQNLHMYKLGLSFNQLKTFPTTAFKGFEISVKVLMLFNPIDCSCNNSMKYKLELKNFAPYGIWAHCESPENVKEVNIFKAYEVLSCTLCDLYPCKNNGACFGNTSTSSCKCTERYSGRHCEVDICSHVQKTVSTNNDDGSVEINHKKNYAASSNVNNVKTTIKKVYNETKYVIVREKVRSTDTENKLVILYAMCSLEFIVIIGFISYFIRKRYYKYKKQKYYDGKGKKKEKPKQEEERFPFDINSMMFNDSVPV